MENDANEKILDFYSNKYNEDGRMMRKPLEFIRCKEIISRYLKYEIMQIADIGGATGVFSYWLANQNHKVHLLDFTQSHIDLAKENGKNQSIELESYTCADARQLPYIDEQFDLVLEMGPLYHLQKEQDRIKCLEEAKRVLKKGGVLLCEVISRYANLFECFQWNLTSDERFIKLLDENLSTGNHSPGETGYFTTAYFHTPDKITDELLKSGFNDIKVISVEGFAQILNVNEILNDEQKKKLLLDYISKTESIHDLFGVSGHFIAVATKPNA